MVVIVALNIKSDQAHRLARELAEATGSSLTEAVTNALEHSLRSVPRGEDPHLLWSEVVELQKFVADLPDRDLRTPDEILGYDATGLPR
jgi:antitoxin VapB